MTPIIWTLVALVASVALCWAIIAWARDYSADLASSSEMLDDYYRAAQKLTRDPATPASVIHFIEFFAPRAGRPSLARGLVWDVLRGRLDKQETPASRAFIRELASLRPELRDAFAHMVTSGVLAGAAADPFFSQLYRRTLRQAVLNGSHEQPAPSVERASTVAVDLTRDCPELVAA